MSVRGRRIPIEELFRVLVERREGEAEGGSASRWNAEALRRGELARLHECKAYVALLLRPG